MASSVQRLVKSAIKYSHTLNDVLDEIREICVYEEIRLSKLVTAYSSKPLTWFSSSKERIACIRQKTVSIQPIRAAANTFSICLTILEGHLMDLEETIAEAIERYDDPSDLSQEYILVSVHSLQWLATQLHRFTQVQVSADLLAEM